MAHQRSSRQVTTVISNVSLTSAAATDFAGPVDVTITDGIITQISAHNPVNANGDEVIDGAGLVLAPGFIDTHVHLLSEQDLHLFTDAGVTTVAKLGTHPDSLLHDLRTTAQASSIISAGSAASTPGGTQATLMGFPEESTVSCPDDAERFVKWRMNAGVDVIKIIIEDPYSPVPGHSLEMLTALVESAHAHGLLTIAHAATVKSYRLGLDAGVDVLTHVPVDRPLGDVLVQRIVAQ